MGWKVCGAGGLGAQPHVPSGGKAAAHCLSSAVAQLALARHMRSESGGDLHLDHLTDFHGNREILSQKKPGFIHLSCAAS